MINQTKPMEQSCAGGFFRGVALLGDFTLAYTLHFYLKGLDVYQSLIEKIGSHLRIIPFFSELNDLLWGSFISLMMIYALTMLIRIYTTFIFGVSLSQWVMGLKGGKGFFWNRLGGVFRIVLEAILAPFIVFDLPPWWGAPSIKERFSATRIIRNSGIYSYAVLPIFLVFIIGLLFMAPLFLNLTLIDDMKMEYGKIQDKVPLKDTDFANYKQYSSNHFKFEAFSSLGEDRFVLIPDFEIITIGDVKKIYPSLMIYDHQNSVFGTMKVSKKISMLNLLSSGRIGNPLFTFKYPVLSKALKKMKEDYQTKVYDPKYGKNTIFSEKTKYEIKSLLKDSLSINVSNIYDHAFHNGPFINGYVRIKNDIRALFMEGALPSISFEKIGNYEFLRGDQNFQFSDGVRRNHFEYLIPIDTENSMVIELNYGDKTREQDSLDEFKKLFFGSIVWYFDYDNIFLFPSDLAEMTPLKILDTFSLQELSQDQVAVLENYTVTYFNQLAKSALTRNDELLEKQLITVLTRFETVINVRNIKTSNYYSEEFLRKMNSIKLALEVKNSEFFK